MVLERPRPGQAALAATANPSRRVVPGVFAAVSNPSPQLVRGDLSAKVAPPPTVADELLALFQRIEQAWKVAEDKLAETRVPIDVRIKVGSGGIGEMPDGSSIGESTTYLAYCRVKGNRRICVVEEVLFYTSGYEPDDIKPVTECPVDFRLEMFDWFDKLYAEANAVAKSYIPKIKEQLEKFERTVAIIDL